MGLLNHISRLNRKIPQVIRFIIGLILLNVPVIIYLTIVGPGIAPIYVAIVFLLINMVSLIAYFKLKVIEVESPQLGKIKIRK